MSRLTISINETGYCNAPYCQEDCNTCIFFRAVLDKLAHYEDLEEQGRLIELPCKVGEPVWVVPFDGDYFDGSLSIKCGDEVFEDVFEVADLKYIGSIIFLTKAEAEEALKRFQENEDKL